MAEEIAREVVKSIEMTARERTMASIYLRAYRQTDRQCSRKQITISKRAPRKNISNQQQTHHLIMLPNKKNILDRKTNQIFYQRPNFIL